LQYLVDQFLFIIGLFVSLLQNIGFDIIFDIVDFVHKEFLKTFVTTLFFFDCFILTTIDFFLSLLKPIFVNHVPNMEVSPDLLVHQIIRNIQCLSFVSLLINTAANLYYI